MVRRKLIIPGEQEWFCRLKAGKKRLKKEGNDSKKVGCSKRLWFPPVLWGGNGQNSRPIRWAGAILYPEFVPFLPASPVGHFR
ncbi:hypothetical protein DNP83_24540, partial [Salmonella enterica subsp. enterica serovar Panama]